MGAAVGRVGAPEPAAWTSNPACPLDTQPGRQAR